jgi:succinyl-CoA synthetase beta subunit
MDIENVPLDEIFKLNIEANDGKLIHSSLGLNENSLKPVISKLKLIDEQARKRFSEFLLNLYEAFVELDATLIEINPLTILDNSKPFCLDTKISIDDNSYFRHHDLFKDHDYSYLSPSEQIARQHDINYIKMDGNIACLVNGAGLAMATMDIIKLKGGNPANFLDIGGGASKEQVSAALGIIGDDSNTRLIYVNIFGGIMRCDIIADGIIDAAQRFKRDVPFVIRLKGIFDLLIQR